MRQLLARGIALAPVPIGGKAPATQGWNKPDKAITREKQLACLTNQNVGILHSYCTPPTCALDVDFYPEARQWLQTRRIQLDDLLIDRNAVVFCSGKKYSIKILYRLPEEIGPLVSKQVKYDAGVALEFRCASGTGLTVMDLIPPSVHPSGTDYRWTGAGNPLAIPPTPASLLRIWRGLIEAGNQKRHRQNYHPIAETPRQRAVMREMLSCMDADCDYFTWRNIVWGLLSTGWESAQELAREWSESSSDSFNEDRFCDLVNSHDPDHEHRHTLGTVIHFARLGGWNE
jgi:hypothetical protein